MVRKPLRVSLPLFWTGSSSQNLYQIIKNPNSYITSHMYPGCHIFGRYAINGPIPEGNINGSGHGDLSVAASRFCSELKKVNNDPSAKDRVSGPDNKFNRSVLISNRKEGSKDSESMLGTVQFFNSDINFRIDTTNRSFIFDSTGNTPSATSVSVSTATTNRVIKNSQLISTNDCFEQEFKGRITMVGKEPGVVQWSLSCTADKPSCCSDGCLKKGMGCCNSRGVHWRSMVRKGTKYAHKCARTTSSEAGYSDIYKTKQNKVDTFSNRQHDCFELFTQDGRNQEQGFAGSKQRDMVLSVPTWDHNYCRIYPKSLECDSRLGVTECQGLLRLETLSNSLSTNLPEVGETRHRSVCLQIESPSSEVCSMETRPLQLEDRCYATELGSSVSICIPTLFSHKQGLKQNTRGQSTFNVTNNTNMAHTSVVPRASSNVSGETFIAATNEKTFNKSPRRRASIDKKPNLAISGVEGFRKGLAKKGLSDTASKLISNSRRDGSISNYDSSWRKWAGWCSGRKHDPFRCNVNEVLEYLASLFEQGYEYRTIGCHRAAISAYHEDVDGKPIGQHPDVCALVNGVFNNRPLQPRYSFIWDVQIILEFIKKNWGNCQRLSNKHLTHKLTMLLALTSASRASAIHHLDVHFMVRLTN